MRPRDDRKGITRFYLPALGERSFCTNNGSLVGFKHQSSALSLHCHWEEVLHGRVECLCWDVRSIKIAQAMCFWQHLFLLVRRAVFLLSACFRRSSMLMWGKKRPEHLHVPWASAGKLTLKLAQKKTLGVRLSIPLSPPTVVVAYFLQHKRERDVPTPCSRWLRKTNKGAPNTKRPVFVS